MFKFNNSQHFMHVYDCRPFQEDGKWYVELWAYLIPHSTVDLSFNSAEDSFEKEFARLMSQSKTKTFKDYADAKLYIPKMELDFEMLTQVNEPDEVVRDYGRLALPARIKNKLYAEKDILFSIEMLNE